MSSKNPICIYQNSCSGCPDIALPYRDGFEQKRSNFLSRLRENSRLKIDDIEIKNHYFEDPKIRCRTDLTIASISGIPSIGFYSNLSEGILDIETCSALTPDLNRGFQIFRENLPAIKKASVRLRISPSGKLGAWLDFSNADIQYLLEQEEWLRNLLENFYVEVGQKRKKLVDIDGRLKLEKESIAPWFETYSGNKSFPLFTQVASFTQPSFLTNKLMIQIIESMSKDLNHLSCIEVGAGIGNFSIPLSFLFENLTCLENDKWSLHSLNHNIDKHRIKAEVKRFDFKTKLSNFELKTEDWVLFLDPPRSGVGNILDNLGLPQKPAYILYVSCFPESFANDCRILNEQGYAFEELHLIDQFPYTKHLEVIGKLKLN